MVIRLAIIILSLVGLANALYFTFAYYGRIKKAKWVPAIFCAREGSSCVTVVQTPYARVFGLPNSLLGILYYVLLMGWAGTGITVGPEVSIGGHALPLSVWGFIAVGVLTVILGFYLVYVLRRKLYTHCPMCYLGHSINAVLLVLMILYVW